MANVVIFNIYTKQVLRYLTSQHTPNYSFRDDVLINPDLTKVHQAPIKYWKVVAGKVKEMTKNEKDILDQAEINKEKNSEIEQVDNLNVSVFDLGKALVDLGIVDGLALKQKIKENKGLV